jgi:hypothetical protein
MLKLAAPPAAVAPPAQVIPLGRYLRPVRDYALPLPCVEEALDEGDDQ